MPCGTQFVYLGILLVYSYLVNSSTKTRGSLTLQGEVGGTFSSTRTSSARLLI